MQLLDARRLTGPNLLFDGAGTIVDVRCSDREVDRLIPVWKHHLRRMLAAIGWHDRSPCARKLSGGVSFGFAAPIDVLYAATEINEWGFAAALSELEGTEAPDFDAALAAIRPAIADEANPGLLDLAAAARERQTTLLWDDHEVSLGLGRQSKTWPIRDLPTPADLDWSEFRDLPIGLVTGTNGKTTTVRLANHILRGGSRNVGLCSTDWIGVNEDIIDRGDWSGPGGARAVLRHKNVDVAILECARGGLLRRGLGVPRADAALITNIAEDHLGDFGSRTLAELLDIKWIVSRAVSAQGRLILNADDTRLCSRADGYPGDIIWFSQHADDVRVSAHTAAGGIAFVLVNHELVRCDGRRRDSICRDDEIPITLHGVARHNIANALAAASLAWCLGASLDDLRLGLTTMSQDDNPGRCNVYDVNGRKVLVDFAHNPHAMQALFGMADGLPARRRVLCFGQAGDRPDELIRKLARSAWAIGLDRVMVSELPKYYRGREPGEVFA
ncbi:MAG: Mur ligase family protein, partial [Gammaproteobacteria bacterium]|nr:Mur ligase family protein [Gammaproteobacteria bacterium]